MTRLYNLSVDCSVKEMGEWVEGIWHWNWRWRRELREREKEEDKWRWEHESKGEYSVKAAYYHLLKLKLGENQENK